MEQILHHFTYPAAYEIPYIEDPRPAHPSDSTPLEAPHFLSAQQLNINFMDESRPKQLSTTASPASTVSRTGVEASAFSVRKPRFKQLQRWRRKDPPVGALAHRPTVMRLRCMARWPQGIRGTPTEAGSKKNIDPTYAAWPSSQRVPHPANGAQASR